MIAKSKYLICVVWASLLVMAFVDATAQDQKIGYINSDEILEKMPEYEGIAQRLDLVSQGWKEELERMDEEIDELQKEFEAKEILFTEEVRAQKKKEIESRIAAREQFLQAKFGPEGEYFKKQKELLEPIQRLVLDAVNTVAETDGFDMIFDRAGDVRLIFTREEWNLNNEVLLELGIELDDTGN